MWHGKNVHVLGDELTSPQTQFISVLISLSVSFSCPSLPVCCLVLTSQLLRHLLLTWITFLFSFWMSRTTSRMIGSNRKPSLTRFCLTSFVSTLFYYFSLLRIFILQFYLTWSLFSPAGQRVSHHAVEMCAMWAVWSADWMTQLHIVNVSCWIVKISYVF